MLGEQLEFQAYCKWCKMCFVHFSSYVTVKERNVLLCFTLGKVMCILSSIVYYSSSTGLPRFICRNNPTYLEVLGEYLWT